MNLELNQKVLLNNGIDAWVDSGPFFTDKGPQNLVWLRVGRFNGPKMLFAQTFIKKVFDKGKKKK